MANIRAAYAEVVTADLTGEGVKSKTVDLVSDTTNWNSDNDAKIGNTKYKSLIGEDTTKVTLITVKCEDGVVTVGTTTIQGQTSNTNN